LNCRYCGTPTLLSHQRQWHDKHASAARAAALRIDAEATVNQNANYALMAALSNVICCWIGVPGVVAVILGARTRSLARSHGLVVPGRALAAMAIGALATVSALAFWIWFGFDSKRIDDRRTELRQRVEKQAAASTLDHDTACSMVELRLLEQGFEGTSEFGISGVHCNGTLTQDGNRATLDEVTFKKSSEPRKVTACFKRGGRWAVDKLATDGQCEGLPPPPPAATQDSPPRPAVDPGRRKPAADPFNDHR
jgi:hypothetical protein